MGGGYDPPQKEALARPKRPVSYLYDSMLVSCKSVHSVLTLAVYLVSFDPMANIDNTSDLRKQCAK